MCIRYLDGSNSTPLALLQKLWDFLLSDVMGLILWTRRFFMEAQGQQVVDKNVVYQDNQSAMLLANNAGAMSSSRQTRHVDIRYFFVADQVANNALRIEYFPTDDMVADYFTKPPLQEGYKFRKFQTFVLNHDDGETEVSGEPVLPVDESSNTCVPWIEVSARRKAS